MGKPHVEFTQALFDSICDRIAEGESLLSIVRDEGMPTYRTVQNWRDNSPELFSQYTRAREIGYDVIAERLRETARGKGESSQQVDRDKLIIDTDIRLLKAWNPSIYGDRNTIAGDPNAPLVFQTLPDIIAPKGD